MLFGAGNFKEGREQRQEAGSREQMQEGMGALSKRLGIHRRFQAGWEK